MSSLFSKWLRQIQTIRHLKASQIFYYIWRRGIGSQKVSPFSGTIKTRTQLASHTQNHSDSDVTIRSFHFTFLNYSINFPSHQMDWNPKEASRLWQYNLHYFKFLFEDSRSHKEKLELIEDWIRQNPIGSTPGWEPYTASLRIVNWCTFFKSISVVGIPEPWLRSLYDQARWLEQNLELHILANHYFENIKAMLFAALFFNDHDSSHWLAYYQQELVAQLKEQTLKDGGHYERSPQYHCILLEDYLDIYALLLTNKALVKAETVATLEKTIESGIRFLTGIATPDDDIPLFNDSASGSASRPSSLFAKARRLGFIFEIPQTTLIDFPESGLFGWKTHRDYFLIDCGDIGPKYQPGHTHCDFLSFVLMIDGQWLVVDSGVYEYEPGEMRSYVRSTTAHNSVIVDDCEQSEIWGEFRVGRRARSLGASIQHKANLIIFEGRYKGFPSLAANIVHRRRVVLTLDSEGTIQHVDIDDKVDGNSAPLRDVKTSLHLHPDLKIEYADKAASNKNSVSIKKGATATVATLSSPHELDISAGPSWFCPEFGLKQPNSMLQIRERSNLPVHFSYKLTAHRSNLVKM